MHFSDFFYIRVYNLGVRALIQFILLMGFINSVSANKEPQQPSPQYEAEVLKSFNEISKLNYNQQIIYVRSLEAVAQQGQFSAFTKKNHFNPKIKGHCSFSFLTYKSDCRPTDEGIVKFFAVSENVNLWNPIRFSLQLNCKVKKQCQKIKQAIDLEISKRKNGK